MTARISMAIDYVGNIVHIKDAISGGEYYCIYYKDRLAAAKGTKQAHHFRHYSKDSESEDFQSYSVADSDYSVLYKEESWGN